MNVLAIIQARMSSSRLPGKILKPILGKPMLVHMLERARRARRISRLVVATSHDASDDIVAATLSGHGVDCYRGPLDDVLGRYCGALDAYGPVDAVMRLTGDCPLVDWRVLDALVERFAAGGFDYASNVHPPSFPDGLDAEIMSAPALAHACREAESAYDREHVTPYFYSHPHVFSCGNLPCALGDLSAHRWTVDEPEDFDKVEKIFRALYPGNPDFTMQDVLEFLQDHPHIMNLNQGIERNAGSRQQDQP